MLIIRSLWNSSWLIFCNRRIKYLPLKKGKYIVHHIYWVTYAFVRRRQYKFNPLIKIAIISKSTFVKYRSAAKYSAQSLKTIKSWTFEVGRRGCMWAVLRISFLRKIRLFCIKLIEWFETLDKFRNKHHANSGTFLFSFDPISISTVIPVKYMD